MEEDFNIGLEKEGEDNTFEKQEYSVAGTRSSSPFEERILEISEICHDNLQLPNTSSTSRAKRMSWFFDVDVDVDESTMAMAPADDFARSIMGQEVDCLTTNLDPDSQPLEDSRLAPNSPSTSTSQTHSTSSYGYSSYGEDQDDDIVVLPDDLSPENDLVAPENMDAVVARQMASLSIEDREKVYFDIHGVSDEVAETPELIQSELSQMELELSKLPDLRAYEMARAASPEYVNNPAFRLSFLRAELFDARKAALRYARHFQAKLDLFGQELLTSDITQDDLDAKTLEALYSGLMQYLPLRDRAGRLVHVAFYHPNEIDLQAKLKRVFYMSMASNEDEETQRKGRVAVGYLAGQNVTGDPRNDWQVAKVLQALPVRMEAVHLCHDSKTIWTPIFSVFKYVVSLFLRMRIREHLGTHEECLFKLLTFGIPIHHCFPAIYGKGNIDNSDHILFWEKRRRLERSRRDLCRKNQGAPEKTQEPQSPASRLENGTEQRSSTTRQINDNGNGKVPDRKFPDTTLSEKQQEPKNQPSKSSFNASSQQSSIGVPGIHDVLLGRGKGFYQHNGNVRFRHCIESKSAAYDNAKTSSEKKQITWEIIRFVQSDGGRFLKDDKKLGWILVDDETARQKVAHVFRSLRAPVVGGPQAGTGVSSSARRNSHDNWNSEPGSKRARYGHA